MDDLPVGAHIMSDAEMTGGSYPGRGEIEGQVLPTVQGYSNPGPTNMRGVEANTDPESSHADIVVPKGTAPCIDGDGAGGPWPS